MSGIKFHAGSTIKRGREVFSSHSLNIGNVHVECEPRIRAKASLFLSLLLKHPYAFSSCQVKAEFLANRGWRVYEWSSSMTFPDKLWPRDNAGLKFLAVYQARTSFPSILEPTCYFDYIVFFFFSHYCTCVEIFSFDFD